MLIIEHDRSLVRIMSAVLARSGISHTLASDAVEAARIIPERRPGVIVFNTELLGPARELTIAALRTLAPGVRILDVHAHAPGEPEPEAGADAVLHKPFRAEQLVDAVRGLLDGAGATPA